MSSLVLSGVGLSADHLPLRGSFLLPESPPPMLEEKEQPQPPVMAVAVRKRNLFCLQEERPAESSSETSSIGDADEDEDEEGDEVESKKREGCGGGGDGGGFDSFDSLEDSLPIKRGLSKFFSGKSKSFANIPDIAAATKVNVLAKPENPFNKRRRLAIRASFTYLPPPPPPPPLSPNKDVEEEEEEEEPEEEEVDSINGDRLVSLPSLLIQ